MICHPSARTDSRSEFEFGPYSMILDSTKVYVGLVHSHQNACFLTSSYLCVALSIVIVVASVFARFLHS